MAQGALAEENAGWLKSFLRTSIKESGADFSVKAVADALPVSLSGQDEPDVQLLNYLRDGELTSVYN